MQLYQKLKKEDFQELKINAHSPLTWGVLLERGEIIFGNMEPTTISPAAWAEPTKEFRSLPKKKISGSISFHLPFQAIYVPLKVIKSIFGIYSTYSFYGVKTSEGKLVYWDSVEDVMRTKYNIFVSHTVGYKLDTWKKLGQIRKIVFHGPTVLYSDWQWFQLISGGINSIGIGLGPVSGNVGWNHSLSKVFWDKIEGPIKKESEGVIIRGRVKILQETIEIEGETWTRLNLSSSKNMIFVCKPRNFMFPIDCFNKIVSQLTVYGEPVHFTGNSKKITMVKVRGIAFTPKK